jgi:hypothetical protein
MIPTQRLQALCQRKKEEKHRWQRYICNETQQLWQSWEWSNAVFPESGKRCEEATGDTNEEPPILRMKIVKRSNVVSKIYSDKSWQRRACLGLHNALARGSMD